MNKNLRGGVAILLLFSALHISTHAENRADSRYFFENISVNEGLSHSDVTAMIQDPDGFIWMGTYNGLCRYDGSVMRVYRSDNSSLSSNRILSLYSSRDSLMYIGTEAGGLNIYDPTTGRIEVYSHELDNDRSLPGNVVNYFFEDHDHHIWICTDSGLARRCDQDGFVSYYIGGRRREINCGLEMPEDNTLLLGTPTGLYVFDPHDGSSDRVFSEEVTDIRALVPLDDGSALVGAENGLYRLDSSHTHILRIAPYDVLSMHIDSLDRIWVGTSIDGVYLLDSDYRVLEHYTADAQSISGSEVKCFCEDYSGVMWIGYIGEGVDKVNIRDKKIELYSSEDGFHSGEMGHNRVITFIEDSHHLLWLGTRGGGIEVQDRASGAFVSLKDKCLGTRDQQKDVSAFYQDSRGDMWVGTWQGLYVIPCRDVDRILTAPSIECRQIDLGVTTSIYKIVEDRDGYMWLSTKTGVYNYIPNEGDPYHGRVVRYTHDDLNQNSLSDNFGTDLFVEPSSALKTIWIGTRSGLDKLTVEDIGVRIRRVPLGDKPLFVSVIHEDREGSLWVATLGGGLFKMTAGRYEQTSPTFESYQRPQYPFADNEFESLQEDSQGNFWIGGYGIARFDPHTGAVRYYTIKDRLQSNSFKIWSSCRLSSGEMVFGGVNGFNVFHPDSLRDNTVPPKVALTGLKLFDEEVHAGDTIRGRVILPRTLNHSDRVTLRYNQNNITFEFAALHFTSPLNNSFRYRLEGFDDKWNTTTADKPYAVYTNLHHGKYRFQVYGANSDGVWNDTPSELKVVIKPPFYLTNLAIAIYFMLIIMGLYYLQSSMLARSEARHQQEMERQLHEEQERSLEGNLKFFTDIAHEIKTPLSLIEAPIEELLDNPMLGGGTRSKLTLVSRNVRRLLVLVQQILDLRKYDNNMMRLRVSEMDLSSFLEEVVTLFRPAIQKKKITLDTSLGSDIRVYVDKEKLEKVMVNLLSNALKFTPEGGEIRLSLAQSDTYVEICVQDNGVGIVREDLERIFDRFYQSSNVGTRGGTGIGLSLCKCYVEQHHGQIWAESEPSQGSRFYIRLLKGSEGFALDEIQVTPDEQSVGLQQYLILDDDSDTAPTETPKEDIKKDATVLIAEDNIELREYLVGLLSGDYNVLSAADGQAAYEMTLSEQPDLIISDIVMPRMTGMELCERIKSNINTSHIPVIILTARDMPSYELEGYATGADAYITKPFSVKMLRTRISNLLKSRRYLREMFRTQVILQPSEVTVTTSDERFLSRCLEVVEVNMHDPEFGVNELCLQVGISRPQLYRKIKSLTGLSAVQFIRSIRLKRAAQILSQDNSSVSDVMYSVGFNNLSYFSKIFKEEFGYLPKQKPQ